MMMSEKKGCLQPQYILSLKKQYQYFRALQYLLARCVILEI